MAPAYQCRSLVRNRLARSLWMARLAFGLSQRELASRVGTSRTHISRIETGQLLPDIQTLRRVAESLGVPASVIVGIAELE